MRFEIRGLDETGGAITRDHVLRRLAFALDRFATRIDVITIRFRRDARRRSPDDRTTCRIHARGHRGAGGPGDATTVWHAAVSENHSDYGAAVDNALARIAHAIGRRLGKPRARVRAGDLASC